MGARQKPWAALLLLLAGCRAQSGSIGALLAQEPGGAIRVREAPPELSGARAGLQPGDEVVSIDGVDVRGMDQHEVHRRLVGVAGSRVELTVVRDGAIQKLSITRAPYRKK